MKVPRCPCILCLLFTTAPFRGKKTHRDNFPVPSSLYKGPIIRRAKCPIKRHLGFPSPSLCLLYIYNCALYMGKKVHYFRVKIIEEICPFPQQRRGMFYLIQKLHFLLRKRALLGCWIFFGSKRPRPPDYT